MKQAKRGKLEPEVWKLGDARDFLKLSDDEAAYIELKLGQRDRLRATRDAKGVSQVELARLIGSSQSRVAKMEAGDPSVSMDLLIKALLALGATRKEIGNAVWASTVRVA